MVKSDTPSPSLSLRLACYSSIAILSPGKELRKTFLYMKNIKEVSFLQKLKREKERKIAAISLLKNKRETE